MLHQSVAHFSFKFVDVDVWVCEVPVGKATLHGLADCCPPCFFQGL